MVVDLRPRLVAARARPGSSAAFVMASLIAGSLSCGQLTLPCWRMLLPLNVGVEHRLRVGEVLEPARRSGRSRPSTCGTPQNFVYSVSCGHDAEVELEAQLLELALDDLGGLLARVGVGRDGQELLRAGPLAVGVDREARVLLLGGQHVLLGHRRVALRVGEEVQVGVLLQAAGLLEAGDARRDPAVGDVAERSRRRASGAGRCGRTPAMIALRTLRLSNGLIVVLMRDVARAAGRDEDDLVLVARQRLLEHRRRRRAGVAAQRSRSRCSARREASVRSSLPSSMLIASR